MHCFDLYRDPLRNIGTVDYWMHPPDKGPVPRTDRVLITVHDTSESRPHTSPVLGGVTMS